MAGKHGVVDREYPRGQRLEDPQAGELVRGSVRGKERTKQCLCGCCAIRSTKRDDVWSSLGRFPQHPPHCLFLYPCTRKRRTFPEIMDGGSLEEVDEAFKLLYLSEEQALSPMFTALLFHVSKIIKYPSSDRQRDGKRGR